MALVESFKLISRWPLRLLGKAIHATTMSKGWTTKSVIPDVIDDVPGSRLVVSYPQITINEGNTVRPAQVKSTPHVSWKFEENALYTLCMTDPDAPSREKPSAREWHHWLVVNIPKNNIDKGDTLAEYIGAGPPEHSGLHRYVFVLYKQPGKLKCSEKKLTNKSADGRGNFSIKKFATKYKLGAPIAGNFFEAEFDDSVPELHKQLGL